MNTAMQSQARVLLLREVATSPVAALFIAERQLEAGPRLAAVKVLKNYAVPSEIVGLQERSAQLGMLDQRHIVVPEQVLEVDGHLALLYPYIDGVDLLDWIEVLRETNTPMPPRVICEVLRGIAVALDAALNRIPWGETSPLRILHCDLKPTNVMIDRDGEIKILDFGTGISRLSSATDVPRSARGYVAPELGSGRPPTHASDIYALGILGIELLANRWLRTLPKSNPDHDLHLGQIVRHADFSMRSAADEQTLRSLLLRMAAYSPASRPAASGASQTLRRLADRAPGPSLESFAHEHALPWLNHAPVDPDTALMVQVMPVVVDVTGHFPVIPHESAEEETNTMSLGDLSSLLENDPTHIFLKDSGWDAEASFTESLADQTEIALERARESRVVEQETEEAFPIAERPLWPEVTDAEVVEILDPIALPPRISSTADPAPPSSRLWLMIASVAMLTGGIIGVGALLVGLLAGLLAVYSI